MQKGALDQVTRHGHMGWQGWGGVGLLSVLAMDLSTTAWTMTRNQWNVCGAWGKEQLTLLRLHSH